MENRNRLRDFPRCVGFFINNRLPSRVYVILCSCFPSYLRQRRSSDPMKLQGLIAIVRSLFGGHRPTFCFIVLPFFGVVLFPSSAICWGCVASQSSHLMDWVKEQVWRGRLVECFKSRFFMLYLSSPLFSFSRFPFLFLVVFSLNGCLLIVIF